MAEDFVSSTGDARTVNNTMRQQYRVLEQHEKDAVDDIKGLGAEFLAALDDCETFLGDTARREIALARTKIEEAVMWAVKGITK
jgi:hypothetical protein